MIDHDHLIVIGAQRSGSTWLYELLDSHPSIYMSRPKRPEPKYFLNENCSRVDYIKEVFGDAPRNERYFGEKSTSYYEHAHVAERIDTCLPSVKLIVILRNPVDRAISNYKFSVENGLETRSLKDVFIYEVPPPLFDGDVSVNPFTYLERGHYAQLLTPFIEKFGNRLFVMVLEEAMGDPAHSGLWDFLQLNPSSDGSMAVNSTDPMEIQSEVKESLQGYYQPHIDALEKLLGRSLDVWLT